ncbi:MAG TPA: hypothetical protein VN426_05585 [Syntrophomonadaceae bacterium]|nr:hypothetical protein [Syntrophomonadaceae bacterium]
MAGNKLKDSTVEDCQDGIKKFLPGNKTLALSFAVALAVANIISPPSSFALDQKTPYSKQNMVLEKEKDERDREWETDEDQSYSYYNPGSGYYYRPYSFAGTSSRHASWTSSPTKKSSVGGYSVFHGHASG